MWTEIVFGFDGFVVLVIGLLLFGKKVPEVIGQAFGAMDADRKQMIIGAVLLAIVVIFLLSRGSW